MRVVVTGGTGFIGSALTRALVEAGGEVVLPSRAPERSAERLFGAQAPPPGVTLAPWDGRTGEALAELIQGADAVVNLAGENIAARRWSPKQKERIRESRLAAGRAVTQALRLASPRPKALVQASAVGFYGNRGDEVLNEEAGPGTGFLAETCLGWEASTREAEDLGVRRVVARTGVVLGRGGALLKMLPPFRFFVGGPLGTGAQWFPWIHLEDEVRALLRLMEDEGCMGVYNLAAPGSLTMRDFCRVLGRVMGRPSWLRVPAWVLKSALGEMAEELLLSGQRAVPARLLDAGFAFRFAGAEEALHQVLNR